MPPVDRLSPSLNVAFARPTRTGLKTAALVFTLVTSSAGILLAQTAGPRAVGAPIKSSAAKDPNGPFKVLQERGEQCFNLAISPDGRYAAWNSFNSGNKVADLRKNTVTDPPFKQEICKLGFWADGIHLVSVQTPSIFTYNLETGEYKQVARWQVTTGTDRLSADGSVIAMTDQNNGAVNVFSAIDGNRFFRVENLIGNTSNLALSPRGRYMLVNGYKNETENGIQRTVESYTKLYDTKTQKELPLDPRFGKSSYNVSGFSDDGKMALTIPGNNSPIALYDVNNANPVRAIDVQIEGNGRVTGVAFALDGKRLIVSTSIGTLQLYNTANGELTGTYTGHHGYVSHMAVSADGRSAISADNTGGVLVWQFAEPRRFAARKGKVERLPGLEAQKTVMQTVKEAFGNDIAKARKPAEKSALADKLLNEAEGAQDMTEKYVLATQSRDLARAAGDPSVLLRAVDVLYRGFDVDLGEQLAADAEAVSKGTLISNAGRELLAEGLLDASERLADEEKYEAAARLTTIAASTARKIKNPALSKAIAAQQSELKELNSHAVEIKAAEATLVTRSDDPAANLLVGKFRCLIKNDWPAGLPHLSKSGDATLEQAAKQELAAPKTPADQMRLADAWYAVADEAGKNEKSKYLAHAATWYRTAVPGLDGLAAVKAKKRLAEIEEK